MSRRVFSRFFLVAALLWAAGCAKVGPDFAKPDSAVMANWLETAGYPQVSTKAEDYKDWWRSFNDPVLDNLIQNAYRQNLNLRIAGVRVLGARAQLGVVVGTLYPQVQQAFGSLQKERISNAGPSSVPGHTPTSFWVSQLGGTASWEIDFWGKIRRAVESADASLMAAVADYDNTLVSLTADVANSYVTLRTLEKRLQIARQNVDIQKKSLEIAKARFEGGTTSRRDVEQALTVLESTEATIPSIESQLRQSQNAICILMGMPPTDLKDLLGPKSDIPAPPPQVAVGIPADLIRRRPDIRSAEWRAAAQCAQIGVAKAALYPAFSLTGTFGVQASDVGRFALDDMFKWSSRSGSFGPAFTWDILNYGRLTNAVRVQDARFQELLIAYQNTVLQAQQEVENSLIAFLKAQQRADKLAASTAAAQRAVDLAILQYREGITDFTTVLTAEQALLSQQDNLASTMGDISGNLVGVYRALGGGWQLRDGQAIVPESIKEAMAKRTNWGGLLAPAVFPSGPPEPPRYKVRPPQL